MNSVLDDPEFKARMRRAYELELQRVEELRSDLAEAEDRLEALSKLQGPATRTTKPRPATLAGDSLRAEAHRVLRRLDPEHRGLHPRQVAEKLLAEGFAISGKARDKTPNVRSTIGYGPKAEKLFRAVGGGLYTWR